MGGPLLKEFGRCGGLAHSGMIRDPPVKRRSFFQGTQSGPERGFDSLPLRVLQIPGGKRMADAAAKVLGPVVVNLPQHAAAIGAGEGRGAAAVGLFGGLKRGGRLRFPLSILVPVGKFAPIAAAISFSGKAVALGT